MYKSRVSVQWRVTNPEIGKRTQLAWMAKNLYDFDDADILTAVHALSLQPVGGAARVGVVQRLMDKAYESPHNLRTLHLLVQQKCEAKGNENRFLSRRLVGSNRTTIETAWHIDPDIREACFRDTVRVPATPGASGPLRGSIRLPPLAQIGMRAL